MTPEGSQAEGTLLSLSASSRRIDDDVRPLIVFSSGRWIPVPSNVGEARTRSLQLETSFLLAALMEGSPPLEPRANIARNRFGSRL